MPQSDRRASQFREAPEPSERSGPIPRSVAALVGLMVSVGVIYLLISEPPGDAGFGDRRTLAALRPASVASMDVGDGKSVFAAHCAACHQADGKGLPGVFPPLDGSEWIGRDARLVVNILLRGIDGDIEVNGKTYHGSMPSFARLSDNELAAVATHVRSAWSNTAPAIEANLFATERRESSGASPFAGGSALEVFASDRRLQPSAAQADPDDGHAFVTR